MFELKRRSPHSKVQAQVGPVEVEVKTLKSSSTIEVLFQSPTENSETRIRPRPLLDTIMSDQVPFEFLPLKPHEFDSLPSGFEYQHEISEDSNTITFDTAVDARDLRCCVVCGLKAEDGPRPGIARAHIIGRTEVGLVRDCSLF